MSTVIPPQCGPKRTAPKCCTECNREFRPKRAQASLYPGTVSHHGRGRCTGCYQRARNQGATPNEQRTLSPEPTAGQLARLREIEAIRIGELSTQRARFEADRARRRIPTTGERRIHVVLTNRFLPVLQEVA